MVHQLELEATCDSLWQIGGPSQFQLEQEEDFLAHGLALLEGSLLLPQLLLSSLLGELFPAVRVDLESLTTQILLILQEKALHNAAVVLDFGRLFAQFVGVCLRHHDCISGDIRTN